ncbi:cobalt/nickel transport protein [Methanococcus voltae]|jgi:cobalt/nickel transport protein|uniref:Cobalt/nickel transport protein n=2 Tax=Methanococcus voltae TaxID=2188 RepID=A0A8J7UTD5_METVO|nr:PDGLE domain-containing protein [Methanococcus voltae]MBP2201548.1 cobalt/nickel transport protein [Methanococcus voltae]MCS3922337.1 cobalt/nickel transport protein [Methanococcus voltae PS]
MSNGSLGTNSKNSKFIMGGLIIALIIGILAPFIASGDPDGLESAAEKIINGNALESNLKEIGLEEEGTVAPSPFADYAIPGMDKIGEIAAMLIGILLMMVLGYGVAAILKKKEQIAN